MGRALFVWFPGCDRPSRPAPHCRLTGPYNDDFAAQGKSSLAPHPSNETDKETPHACDALCRPSAAF